MLQHHQDSLPPPAQAPPPPRRRTPITGSTIPRPPEVIGNQDGGRADGVRARLAGGHQPL
jgi:hypothetical protein